MIGGFLLDFISDWIFFILHVTGSGSFPKPLSAKEEKEYLEKLNQGDQNARNTLIEHNLRLVAHIIKKYYANSSDQDDLISIGTIGLIKAVDSFDTGKGIRLSSYAARCIENEILMFFRTTKKTAQDVSMNEPIDTDRDGNALTLMEDVYKRQVVIVAQRISSIMDANKIIVLDNGEIVGYGSHADLIQTCPVYLESAESQLTKEELAKWTK